MARVLFIKFKCFQCIKYERFFGGKFMNSNESVNCSLTPLQQWYCDSCGEVIESVENGWLEWYADRDNIFKEKGFRIVHHNKSCMYNEKWMYKVGKSVSDSHLDSFAGADGLVRLLSKIQLEYVEDNAELIEIIRRLHVPYYEEARKYHDEAEADGYFDGKNEYTRYITRTSIGIINKYNTN